MLGSLEVSHDGRPVDVRGPLPRRLLALLARTPGQEVSPDSLVDGLWGEAPPTAPGQTLQSHVARLRRALPDPGLVRTGRHGYLLDVPPEAVDAVVFEQRIEEGTRHVLAGRLDRGSVVLADALALWRGPAYGEFVDCPELAVEGARLERLRLDAVEHRLSADLGRPGVVAPVAELEALVRWHPTHEGFWALLMVAQYRAGRQSDALASYQRARRVLADELGVDPGTALRELERLVLAQDPSLDGPTVSSFLPSRRRAAAYPDPVALLEREGLLEALDAAHAEARDGSGRLVLVHGEAGVGKSALVRAWAGTVADSTRVLLGACDPLSSPRPLGALADVAPDLDPLVGEMLLDGAKDGLFDAAMQSLGSTPTVLVFEDLHWADMSTYDLVRYLARRLPDSDLLVIATYRDDQLDASHPLRVALGDIATSPAVSRLPVPLLSRDAVAALAAERGVDVDIDRLHEETGGNAFFVTEVLAAGGESLPATVQDAVLARLHRLSPQARLALESASVVGARVEPSLLHGLPDVAVGGVDECVAAGMLVYDAPVYAFRHELLRQAVLSGINPGRLGAIHWQVLDRLRTMPISPRPYARLADHAEHSGDVTAILEFAVLAARSAAGLGAHREAAYQFGRALPYADLLELEERIELLTRYAEECDTADQLHASAAAWESLIDLLRGLDRPTELARAQLRASGTYSTVGNTPRSLEMLDEAVEILEALPPGPELALAFCSRSGQCMVSNQYEESLLWGARALTLAREVGATSAEVGALNNLGVSRVGLGEAEGLDMLRESLRMARENELETDAARAYVNLGFSLQVSGRLADAMEVVEEGMVFTADHDLHGNLMCLMSSHVEMALEAGEWDTVLEEAHDLLYVRSTERASRSEPLVSAALVHARRGDVDGAHVWALLDEALAHIADTQQLQYDAAVAWSRAEVHVLEGDDGAVEEELRPHLDEALRLRSQEFAAPLALWLWRVGRLDDVPDLGDHPEALSIAGRCREAADAWRALGRPYDQAWALLDSDDEVDLREARALFAQLGAGVLVGRTDHKLRSLGAPVPRGARASTRANIGGLTDREAEVLALLDEGLRNADIAARLHLSEKTVGNHVSSILAKLGATSRLEAVRRARDLAAAG